MNLLAESISGSTIVDIDWKADVRTSRAISCAKHVNDRDALQSCAKCITKSLGLVVETIHASSAWSSSWKFLEKRWQVHG